MKHLLLAAAFAVAAGLANAGTVQLVVTDRDGKPAPDVVVLVDAATRAAVVPAPAPVVITQEDLRFVPFLTVVPLGSTLRFTNKDNYDHHVRSTPSGPLGSVAPAKSFELRLDAAGGDEPPARPGAPLHKPATGAKTTSGDVKVDAAGPIGLGCHIHASMRGQVYVSPTPLFAKTDTNGVARIENVPDGSVDVTLWHADQLQDQAALKLQVGASAVLSSAQLNFVPRRRRGS